MSNVDRLTKITKALDALDGKPNDGWYGTIIPLRETSIGVCAEHYKLKKRNPKQAESKPNMVGPNGNMVPLNCESVQDQLEKLVEIAKANPVSKIFTAKKSEAKALFDNISYDDFFVYHVVDNMITSLLIGASSSDSTLAENFNAVEFESISDLIPDYIKFVPEDSVRWKPVVNLADAYSIFERFMKKYNLDPKSFMY